MEESYLQISRPEHDVMYDESGDYIKAYVPRGGFEESNDFTLVGNLGPGSMDALSIRARVTGHLFDLMSGASDIDHPLCEECTDHLLDSLDHQLKLVEDESKEYREFLEKLGYSEEEVNDAELDEELRQLMEEERQLKDLSWSGTGRRLRKSSK
ncbi:Beclin-1 [Bulinus truncatus]|nr:Beclin-1 [Bulinus truncatus]